MADPIGSALGAFGSSSVVPTYFNKGVNKNLNYLGNQFQGDDASIQNALKAFNSANASTISNLNAAGQKAGNEYDQLYQQNANYNPLDTYNSIRSGNLNALQGFAGQLEGAGSAQDKLALAAMGMGGTPDSSYASILRSDRVSKNIAPVLGNIMSSLGSDTNTVGNLRNQNFQNQMGIIGQQTQLPMLGYGMQLDPANALLSLRGGQVGQLGNMANVARTNTAGFTLKPDTLSQVGNALNGFNDAAWQNIGNAMSVYSSLYGGGALGGSGVKTGNPSGGAYPNTGGAIGLPTTQQYQALAAGQGPLNPAVATAWSTSSQNPYQTTSPIAGYYDDPWSNYNGGAGYGTSGLA